MTPPHPDLLRAAHWSAALAAALDEISGQVGALARRLADDWTDARGQEWTERLVLLRHELARDADAAAELGRAIDRAADDPGPGDAGPVGGPRLGGTAARRADDRRGVTIPRLHDAADDGG